jgi:hypothetical protein
MYVNKNNWKGNRCIRYTALGALKNFNHHKKKDKDLAFRKHVM